jgi:Saxitoxin biosynthesis operon protein SxtJ
MAERIPARLTAEGRKFGLTVGPALLVFAGIAWWRGRQTSSTVLASLGVLLLLAALVIPAQLDPVRRAWMGLAHLISKVTTPIFLGLVYFIGFAPTGFFVRVLGRDPLRHERGAKTFWHEHPEKPSSLERQF